APSGRSRPGSSPQDRTQGSAADLGSRRVRRSGRASSEVGSQAPWSRLAAASALPLDPRSRCCRLWLGARRGGSRDSGRGIHVFLVERLVLQERVREGVELASVLLQQRNDLLMRLIDDAPNLVVDALLGGRRDLGGAGQEWARPAAGGGRDGGDRQSHAPTADHLAGDLSELLDVRLRSGADLVEDDFLGGPAAE